MSVCHNCTRRTARCHADCADYLIERVRLDALAEARRGEQLADDCAAAALWRGGRRKTGKKAYKGCRTHNWKYGKAYGLLP